MMAEEMNMGEVVMVVDDNKEIVYSISELLKYEGYRVIPAYDGMEALNLLEQNPVDLILLDVMMPRLNGLSALMKLREKYRIPVIILSAKTEESDKVSGLVLGADDYVEKPYNPAELMARVKAHLRRYRAWGGELPKENDDQIINGGLVLDKKQRIVLVEGEEVRLTATEYKILELLMEHPGQVFSSEQIYENVWKEEAINTETIMVHVRKLREKINIPILMVTARREDIDKIRGLGLGADDYIEKPFSPGVLVARVKANLSQYQRLTGKRPAPSEIILGDVRVNTGTHRVFVENREIELKNKEYELLLYLMLNVDLVFDRETLYEKVWGLDAMGDNATVAVHINRLREKIEKDPSKPRYIETVWGAGYRFKGVSRRHTDY